MPIRPLAQAEIAGVRSTFLERAFADIFPTIRTAETADEVTARAMRGGYPEPLLRSRADRRETWFGNYIATVVPREVTPMPLCPPRR